MRVIGYHPSSFTFEDGRSSSGFTLYLGEQITVSAGSGMRTERVYMSAQKLNGYVPRLNDDVLIERSSSGSARRLYLLEKAK